MSQDDPKAGDDQHDSPPGPTVNRDKLPRADPDSNTPSAAAQPPRRGGPGKRALLALGAVLLIVGVLIGANAGGGKPTPSPPPEPLTPPEQTTTTDTATTTEQTTTTTTPTPTKPAYPHPIRVAFTRNTPYSIDTPHITREGYGAVVSNDVWGGSSSAYEFGFLEGGSEGKVAPWTGQGAPTFAACQEILNSATQQHVPLEEPGHWICAETPTGRIGFIRYEGSSNESEIFNLYMMMYIPGHS